MRQPATLGRREGRRGLEIRCRIDAVFTRVGPVFRPSSRSLSLSLSTLPSILLRDRALPYLALLELDAGRWWGQLLVSRGRESGAAGGLAGSAPTARDAHGPTEEARHDRAQAALHASGGAAAGPGAREGAGRAGARRSGLPLRLLLLPMTMTLDGGRQLAGGAASGLPLRPLLLPATTSPPRHLSHRDP